MRDLEALHALLVQPQRVAAAALLLDLLLDLAPGLDCVIVEARRLPSGVGARLLALAELLHLLLRHHQPALKFLLSLLLTPRLLLAPTLVGRVLVVDEKDATHLRVGDELKAELVPSRWPLARQLQHRRREHAVDETQHGGGLSER